MNVFNRCTSCVLCSTVAAELNDFFFRVVRSSKYSKPNQFSSAGHRTRLWLLEKGINIVHMGDVEDGGNDGKTKGFRRERGRSEMQTKSEGAREISTLLSARV